MKLFLSLVLCAAVWSPASGAARNDARDLYFFTVKDRAGSVMKLGKFVARKDMKRAIGNVYKKRSASGKGQLVGGYIKVKPGECYVIYAKKKKSTGVLKYYMGRAKTMAKAQASSRKRQKRGYRSIKVGCHSGSESETNVAGLGFHPSTCPSSSRRANQRFWTHKVTDGIYQIYGGNMTQSFNLRQRGNKRGASRRGGKSEKQRMADKVTATMARICGDNPNSVRGKSGYQKLKQKFFDYDKRRNLKKNKGCATSGAVNSRKCPAPSKNGGPGVRG